MTKHRDGLMAAGALAAVLIVLALGFHRLGSWAYQRAIRADERRIEDLRGIALGMYHWHRAGTAMPGTLAGSPQSYHLSLKDPVTNAPYEYHPQSGSAYELCATFATADTAASDEEEFRPHSPFWNHPKGRQCYPLDASGMDY